jgi:molybdopterin synthase catalytic subunit
MTERRWKIVDDAKSRWDIIDVMVVHRVGTLRPCDQIVLVIVPARIGARLSPHASS